MSLRAPTDRHHLMATASPPQSLDSAVDRLAVRSAIGAAVESSRVTVVSAPSGYGKSVAVGEWARTVPMPVAWLTLSRFDRDPVRLLAAVVRAVRSIAVRTGDPAYLELLTIDPHSADVAASYEAVCLAVAALESPVALVIDDVQRAGDQIGEGIIGALVEAAPSTLRLVLVGRDRLRLHLKKLELQGEVRELGVDLLRFDADEVAAVAAALGQECAPAEASAIIAATEGWPAAVRLTLLSASGAAPGDSLTDFVAEEILEPLPVPLREFVLAATVYPELTVANAVAITEEPDAAALLEECIRRALFLERFGDAHKAPVYRWHSIFRSECMALLTRRDPAQVATLQRRAAGVLAHVDPVAAVDQALRAGDAAYAVEILLESWVSIVAGPHGGTTLGRICSVLPATWATDPRVRFIRACGVDLVGDRADAQRQYVRAAGLIDPADHEAEQIRDLAGLLLVDDHASLAAIADRVRNDLEASELTGPRRVATLWLLGMTEVRLRHRPQLAARTLEAAEREATALGDALLARRSAGQLAFAHAFMGEFERAEAVLARLQEVSGTVDGWDTFLGGAESAAAGWVAYWRADFTAADRHFRLIIDGGPASSAFSGIARMYLAFIAAAVGDAAQRSEATELLRGLLTSETHGVPWPAYRLISLAKLAEAEGRAQRAGIIARRFEFVTNIPAVGVMVAELLRRTGDDRAALSLLEQVRSVAAPYVRVSAGVVAALVQRGRGNTSAAHEILERTLQVAAPLHLLRPFVDDEPLLRTLLIEHTAWGTHFEPFLAAATRSPASMATEALSEREREILGYLRTTMTASEIAADLHLSINTVKTHLRALYRKLGVSSRREAVRVGS